MNRLCVAALVIAACGNPKDPIPAPYIYPFGLFSPEAHASAFSLCPGPPKIDTESMPDSAAGLRAPVDAVWESCEALTQQHMSIQTEWDRGTGRIYWMSLAVHLPIAEFDQDLDAIVAKAFDPWLKVVSHAQLVAAIKASTIIGTSTWSISTDMSREGLPPGWTFVTVRVDDLPVEKMRASEDAARKMFPERKWRRW